MVRTTLILLAALAFCVVAQGFPGGRVRPGPLFMLGDFVGMAALPLASFFAARWSRRYIIFFTFGRLGGCIYGERIINEWGYLNPGPRTRWDGPLDQEWLAGYAMIIGMGVVCRLVAMHRHHLMDQKKDPTRCRNCNYLLIGLSEPRCPECGTRFGPELLASSKPISE